MSASCGAKRASEGARAARSGTSARLYAHTAPALATSIAHGTRMRRKTVLVKMLRGVTARPTTWRCISERAPHEPDMLFVRVRVRTVAPVAVHAPVPLPLILVEQLRRGTRERSRGAVARRVRAWGESGAR